MPRCDFAVARGARRLPWYHPRRLRRRSSLVTLVEKGKSTSPVCPAGAVGKVDVIRSTPGSWLLTCTSKYTRILFGAMAPTCDAKKLLVEMLIASLLTMEKFGQLMLAFAREYVPFPSAAFGQIELQLWARDVDGPFPNVDIEDECCLGELRI